MERQGLLQSFLKKLGIGPQNEPRPAFEEFGRVVPDPTRCVQCGICGYNCPVGIPVRDYAHRGLPVDDSACITCGQCIAVCPRGTLRWETEAHSLVIAHLDSS